MPGNPCTSEYVVIASLVTSFSSFDSRFAEAASPVRLVRPRPDHFSAGRWTHSQTAETVAAVEIFLHGCEKKSRSGLGTRLLCVCVSRI